MKKISIVIPIFNEELLVEELIRRLQGATKNLKYHFSFILVDDGSKDTTLGKLISITKHEPRLKILKLSRNWGHQNAYNAGIDYSEGDAVILMDGDLEDPPELIKTFLDKWENGYDVISGVKMSRHGDLLNKFFFFLFYKLISILSNVPVDQNVGMFSLLDKKVVREIKKCSERNKFYVGLRAFAGFKQIGVNYHREKRFAGKPKQTFSKLLNYALNAFFSFSFIPIRIGTYCGLILLGLISVFSAILIIGRLTNLDFWFFQNLKDLPGWTSVVLLILFLMGMQIIFLGIIGEYIARIYDEVRGRPYYVVEEIIDPSSVE